MVGFVLRRAGAALIVIFLASVLVFAGVRALPGDPAIALGGENRDAAVLERHPAQVRTGRAAGGPVRQVGVARAPRRPGRRLPAAAGSAHDRDTAADHASSWRGSAILFGTVIGIPRGSDRGSPPREGLGSRRDDVRARRALVAALLARPAADHSLRRQPRMAAGRRVRAVYAKTRSRTCGTCCFRRSCSAPGSRLC